MLIQRTPPLHLTYCLNIHPGETWAQNRAAICDKATGVRDKVARGGGFGLGLRLSHRAADELNAPGAIDELRGLLAREALYVFTINGFPYGPFHGEPVKESVYQPDWRTIERRDYTLALAEHLAALLPEGVSGSISTVPGSYKPWITDQGDVDVMAIMLADVAFGLHELHERTGREVCLCLEPEPDCYIETTDEAIAFFAGPLAVAGTRHLRDRHGLGRAAADRAISRHLGLCFDTAHAAVEFEDLPDSLARLRNAGVRIGKIQLSSALSVRPAREVRERLREFCDAVYLHQVKARDADGQVTSYPDLPAALDAAEASDPGNVQWRVHFHVPLFFDEFAGLESTSSLLTGPFADAVRAGAAEHVEIETYTFDVLPDSLRPPDVTDCIAREYQWVLTNILGQTG